MSTRFEQEVGRIVQQRVLMPRDAYSIYSLAAVLELPLMADTEASLRQLLRHCARLRDGRGMQRTVDVDPINPKTEFKRSLGVDVALLDVLQVVAGAYFGQDQALRLQYREEGVHV